MIRLDDVELTSAEQAIQHYLAVGLLPILVHAPTEVTDKPEAACTCGQIHKAAGKHPIASAWQKPRSLDELKNQLAKVKFEPNVGIILGSQPAGGYLVAIDVDDEARFAELQEKLGPLPETVRSESGRGFHLFFELPREIPLDQLKNVTGLGGVKGVDIKAERGQVVVAPSTHLSGRKYRWSRTGNVALLPMTWAMEIAPSPEAPTWSSGFTPQSMREDGRTKKRAEKYLEQAVTRDAVMIAGVREGSRNDTLYKRAVRLFNLCASLHLGGQWSYVYEQLRKAALASGLPELEVQKTLQSAEKFVREHSDLRVPVALAQPPKHTNGVHQPATPAPADGAPAPAPAAQHGSAPPAAPTDPGNVPLPQPGSAAALSVPLPFDGDPFDHIYLLNDKGAPAKTAGNVERMLTQHPIWRGGPRWDTYSQTVLWPMPLPDPLAKIHRLEREIVDADHAAVQDWLMQQPDSHRIRAGTDVCADAISLAASRRKIDLLRDWCDNVVPDWDGTDRLDTWTVDYLGMVDSPLIRAMGRAWLVAAMERVYRPGYVVDVIPVLEGLQGSGKNHVLNVLFEGGPQWAPWLVVIAGHKLDHPDMQRVACSRWVMHDDELQAADPKRVQALKSWASRTHETYRLQYNREISVSPRRAILVTSTNQDIYLHDDTGNRRWWSWATGKIQVASMERDRMQLLAEARDVVKALVPTVTSRELIWQKNLTPDMHRDAMASAEERRIADPLVDRVARLLDGPARPQRLTTGEIAAALGFGIGEVDRSLETRVGAAMRQLGYLAKRDPATQSRVRVYEKP